MKPALSPSTHLSDLAVTRAGASRVFHRHGLDFCCHGHTPLAQACEAAGLDPKAVIRELEAEDRLSEESFKRWDENPIPELIAHLLAHFHEAHREELPRLLQMARKVEKVHGSKASCPSGLAEHLHTVAEELDLHMKKEEQVLFPMILSGRGFLAGAPIHAMEAEHKDHGLNLERLRSLAHNYVPPEDACGTWRALYLGLEELEREVMQHIHLENNVLFPRVLRG